MEKTNKQTNKQQKENKILKPQFDDKVFKNYKITYNIRFSYKMDSLHNEHDRKSYMRLLLMEFYGKIQI